MSALFEPSCHTGHLVTGSRFADRVQERVQLIVVEDEARQQIALSKTMLEDMLGSEVTNFAYPYVGNHAVHREMCREAGYETATTTVRARARASDDPFGMPRVYVRRRDLAPKFIYRLMTR